MSVGAGPASRLKERVRIERPQADQSFRGSGKGGWVAVIDVQAEVQDILPSRAEKMADGFNIAARPARLRIRFRTDVTPAMRFTLLRWDGADWVSAARIMQIVSGPAEVGRREWSEFMVEDYSSAGNAA